MSKISRPTMLDTDEAYSLLVGRTIRHAGYYVMPSPSAHIKSVCVFQVTLDDGSVLRIHATYFAELFQ